MGRASKYPAVMVQPVSSKKQLLDIDAVCQFMAGMSRDSLEDIRKDKDLSFPKPLQMLGRSPLWSVDQIERFVARQELKAEQLTV